MQETPIQFLGGEDPLEKGKIPWRRDRLPTPVSWPGEFHGSDTTERLALSLLKDWRSRQSSRNLITTGLQFYNLVNIQFFWLPLVSSRSRQYLCVSRHPSSSGAAGTRVLSTCTVLERGKGQTFPDTHVTPATLTRACLCTERRSGHFIHI